MASWIGFKDSLSGIGRYEYSITTDDTVLVNWTTTGLDTIMIDNSLILLNGQQYFSHIRAFDEVGNVSSVITTDGITADLVGPIGTYVFDGDSIDIDRQNNLLNTTDFGQNSWINNQVCWDMKSLYMTKKILYFS